MKKLTQTLVRKTLTEIINTGIDRGDASQINVDVITRGMAIDLDNGTVTLKFKPQAESTPAPSKTKTKSKAKPKAAVASDVPAFERGEKAELKREFKANIEDQDDVKLNMFGKVIELKGSPALIVGFENGKFRVKNTKGKVVNGTRKAVLEALSGEAPAKKVSSPKRKSAAKTTSKQKKQAAPAKAKKGKKSKTSSSRGTKQSTASGAKVVKKDPKGKNPYNAGQIKKMKADFTKAAKSLKTQGLAPSQFWKAIELDGKVYRIVAASAKQSKVRLLNVKTGSTVVKSVAAVFPLSN